MARCAVRTAQVTVPLTARRRRYHSARYVKGPPQVHPRSIRDQRKLARTGRLEGRFTRGRSLHPAAHPATRQARPAAQRGQTKAIPASSSVPATSGGSYGPSVGQTLEPPVILPESDGLLTEKLRPLEIKEQAVRRTARFRSSPRFRPLYVRAQLETAGLPWTLRDLTAPKAPARETGKTQLTGYLRRWWKVLGSNQRRLSRRFYRALPGIATQAIHLHEHRPGASRPMRSTAPQPKPDPHVQSCPAGADGSRDDSSVALPDRSGPACQGAALPYPISPTGAGR